jgi:hypothetical protein
MRRELDLSPEANEIRHKKTFARFQELLKGPRVHGTEKDLVRSFLGRLKEHSYYGLVLYSPYDKVIPEMRMRYGRADITIFHVDGTASVIEAKDGSYGYGHVVSGLGQVVSYGAQLALINASVKRVRRYLLWSSTGNESLDSFIVDMCIDAKVIPLLDLPIHEIAATYAASQQIVDEELYGSPQEG